MKALAVSFAILLSLPLGAATLSIKPLARPIAPRVTEQGGGFSVDLPIVGRVHGASATFFTSLDVTDNTAQPTEVDFTFVPADGSTPRFGVLGTLAGFDNLHIDDFMQSLQDAGLVTPAQTSNSYGTLLLTFMNASFTRGTEATAVARVYSFTGNGNATYGLAYRAPALRTNGAHSLTSVVHGSGGMVTNIGVENVGINDAGASDTAPVTIRLTFYDLATGAITGAQPQYVLAPGQVLQLNDVAKANSMVFVDEISGTAQIRGYAVMKDIVTNDGSFVFMQESQTATF